MNNEYQNSCQLSKTATEKVQMIYRFTVHSNLGLRGAIKHTYAEEAA